MPRETDFERHRTRLFSVAYRMLGQVTEAEDLVQDTYVEWATAEDGRAAGSGDGAEAGALRAYLAVLSGLALERLREVAEARRLYDGAWLPEPCLDADEVRDAEMEIPGATAGYLLRLEGLPPVHRAAYVLCELYGGDRPAVAAALDEGEPELARLLEQAGERMGGDVARYVPDPASRSADLRVFRTLVRRLAAADDPSRCRELLADTCVVRYDGGGVVGEPRQPAEGAAEGHELLAEVHARELAGCRTALAPVNGESGAVYLRDGRLQAVLWGHVEEGRNQEVYLVAHPAKMSHLNHRLPALQEVAREQLPAS